MDGVLGVLLDARLVAGELRSPSPSCCLVPTSHTDAVLSQPATLWEALLVVAAWWLLLLLLLTQELLVVLQQPTCWDWVPAPCTCCCCVVCSTACLAQAHQPI